MLKLLSFLRLSPARPFSGVDAAAARCYANARHRATPVAGAG